MKNLDFLPQQYRDARRTQRQRRSNLRYSLVLAIALFALHVANASRIRSAEAALGALLADGGVWESARAQVNSLQARKEILEKRAALVGELEDNAPLDSVIAEITALLSKSMAIRSLVVQTDAAIRKDAQKDAQKDAPGPAGEPGPGRTRVQLVGVAANDVEVGVFFGRLSACPLFEDVNMTFCHETQAADRPMREFELKFAVKRVEIER